MGGKGHQSSWPFPCQAQPAPKVQVWRLSFVGKMMMNHWFRGTLFPDRPISRFWFLKIREDVSFMKRTFKRMLLLILIDFWHEKSPGAQLLVAKLGCGRWTGGPTQAKPTGSAPRAASTSSEDGEPWMLPSL